MIIRKKLKTLIRLQITRRLANPSIPYDSPMTKVMVDHLRTVEDLMRSRELLKQIRQARDQVKNLESQMQKLGT